MYVCTYMLCHTYRQRVWVSECVCVCLCVNLCLNAHLVKPQKQTQITHNLVNYSSQIPFVFSSFPQSPHISKLYDPEMIVIISFETIFEFYATGNSMKKTNPICFSHSGDTCMKTMRYWCEPMVSSIIGNSWDDLNAPNSVFVDVRYHIGRH